MPKIVGVPQHRDSPYARHRLLEHSQPLGCQVAGDLGNPGNTAVQKYFLVLFIAVVVPLLINGTSETWFGYRDQRVLLGRRLRAEAGAAAGKITGFLTDITDQLQWTVQLPWITGGEEQHRLDILRLMRQVPAILDVTEVDSGDIERLHVSRINPDVVNSGIDRHGDPAVRHGGL